MTETKYLPAEWLDEVVPSPVAHPDDLISIVDGVPYLVGKFHDRMTVTHGEFVEFCEFRDHGHWAITIEEARDADGNAVWRGGETIDAEANCFHFDDGYAEAFGGTLDEMVAAMVEDDPDICGTFSVHAYHWSSGKPWYFAIVDDSAHFSPPGTFGSEAVH